MPASEEVKNIRGRRAAAAIASEYDALNGDFVTEYDSLNLDFNMDGNKEEKEAKEVAVPAREFIWQGGQARNKSENDESKKEKNDDEEQDNEEEEEEIFPPKEWWGDDEPAEGTARRIEAATAQTTTIAHLLEEMRTTTPSTMEMMTTASESTTTTMKTNAFANKAIGVKNKKMAKGDKFNWHVGSLPFDEKQVRTINKIKTIQFLEFLLLLST